MLVGIGFLKLKSLKYRFSYILVNNYVLDHKFFKNKYICSIIYIMDSMPRAQGSLWEWEAWFVS